LERLQNHPTATGGGFAFQLRGWFQSAQIGERRVQVKQFERFGRMLASTKAGGESRYEMAESPHDFRYEI